MSLRYCVFWIPCVTHGDLSLLPGKGTLQSDDIKTTNGFEFKIKSEAVVKNDSTSKCQVIIGLTLVGVGEIDPDFKNDFRVNLCSCNICKNGLVEFEYSLSEEQHRIFDDLRDQVYDLIKGHFHKHEHHTYFTSVKHCLPSNEYIELASKDNKAIVFYIKQFYGLLKEQLSQIEDDYALLLLEKNRTSYVAEIKQARILFYESCENVFGQLVYYNSIFNSKWNASCRVTPTIPNPDDELRLLSHNFGNLAARLRAIYRRSRSAFYISNIYENAEVQKRISDVLKASGKSNVISIILGGVSAALAIWALIITQSA